MISSEPIPLLLARMRQAAADAHRLLDGAAKADFMANMMLNRSVAMSLLMATEIASQLLKGHPDFVAEHPDFPWSAVGGMRNRIVDDYFDIDLDRVWDIASTEIDDLVSRLDSMTNWRAQGE